MTNNPEKIIDDDDKPEKSKKSKKFLSFFSKFIKNKSEQSDKEVEEKDSEKISYLDLLKSFIAKEQEEETDDTDGGDDDFSLDEVKDYLDEELDETTSELVEGNLTENEYYRHYENYLVLESINKKIENEDDIDVNEIVNSVQETLDKTSLTEERDHSSEQENTSPTEIQKPSEKVKKYVFELLSKDVPARAPDKVESTENQNKVENIQTVTVKPEEDIPDSGPNQIKPERPTADIPDLKVSYPKTETLNHPDIIEHKDINLPPEETHKEPLVTPVIESLSRPRTERQEVNPTKPSSFNAKPRHNKPAIETGSKISATSEPEKIINKTIDETREDLSYGKLLQEADRVLIDGVSLRKIFENSNLNQADLRDLLESKHDKKKFKKLLARSLKRRHDNYESIRERISGLSSSYSSGRSEINTASHGNLSTNLDSNNAATNTPLSSVKGNAVKSGVKKLNHPFITIMVLILLLIFLLLLSKYLF